MQRSRVKGAILTKLYPWKQYRRTWNTTTKDWNKPTVVKNTTVGWPAGQEELIVDVYRSAPRKRVNFEDVLPVTHTKLMISLGSYYPLWYNVTSAGTTQEMNEYGAYGTARSFVDSKIPPLPSLASLPHREAIEQFNAGGVATETSLPNFLLELGEIKSLFSLISLRRLREAFRRRESDKEISSGFLAYNFGIKPLLGDLQAIGSYTTSLQKRLEWLLENRGQTVSLDFRKTLSNTPPANGAPATINSYQWVVWQEYKSTYHAFCRWKVDYDPVKQAFEKLRYFNRYFGTKKLLTIAWEAVPYSFVVDWVTNLGSLLKQFEVPSTLRKGITSLGYSIKQSGTFVVKAGWYPSYNPAAISTASTVSFHRYTRSPGLPTTIQSSFDLSSATGRQQALAMALAHQRFR